MKISYNLLIILLLFSSNAWSQVINGRILNAKTGEAIMYANVYLEGTTIGITSDGEGHFILNTKNKITIPLIVSTIGYQSFRLEKYSLSEELIIKLEPNTYELDALVIKAKKISRQPRLRIFKEAFLGRSKNAANCIIENENAIILEMSEKTNTLYAHAKEPLVITNKALGYKINYHLKEFSCSGEDVFYSGTYFFTEIPCDDKSEIKRRKKKRHKTYKGSRLNLIRSFYNRSLNKDNFEVYYSNYKKVKLDEIFHKDLEDGDKLIYFLGDLIVYFKYTDEDEVLYLTQKGTQKVATSFIKQKGGIRVTKDGYFDPNSLVWSGDISFYRVADLLPYDYVAKQ